MGAYLSQPVRSKQEFAGAKAGFLSYGGSSMQACHALSLRCEVIEFAGKKDLQDAMPQGSRCADGGNTGKSLVDCVPWRSFEGCFPPVGRGLAYIIEHQAGQDVV